MTNRTKLIAFGTVLAALVVVALLVLSQDPGDLRAPSSPLQQASEPLVAEGAQAVEATVQESRPDIDVVTREEISPTVTIGSLLVTVRWSQGDPAPGIAISFWRETSGLYRAVLEREVSDQRGEIRVDGLPAGTLKLRSDRGDSLDVEVVAGRQEDCEFTLPAGIEVTGVVTDRRDQPVAGAGVWLQTEYNHWSGGRVIAHTEADGTFAVAEIREGLSLGAVAAGYAPSRLIDLDLVDTSSPAAAIHLVLEDGSGVVEGRVVNPAGAPIADALIVVGEAPSHMEYRGGDGYVEKWTQRTALSNEEGRFALDGIKTGTIPIAGRAKGFGLWRAEVEVSEGERTWLDITLAETVTVTGTVTDERGAPLSGARVRAYDRAPQVTFISMGQIDFGQTFGYVGAISDVQGRYRLTGATPGEVHLFAQPERNLRTIEAVPYVRAILEAEPADELEWNPVISPGRTIEGIVLYQDGHPMGEVAVFARDEAGDERHVMVNDAEGRFRFSGLEGASYNLHVQYWTPPPGTPPLDKGGVVPGPGLVELRAPFPKPVEGAATAEVVGRIDDAGGRLPNPQALQVILSSDRGFFHTNFEFEAGAFRFERIKAGRYRVVVMAGTTAVVQSDWFEVAEAEVRDMGVLTTERGGSVVIKLERDEEDLQLEPTIILRRDGWSRGARIEMGRLSQARLDNLTPGRYEVLGSATGTRISKSEVEVRVGEEPEVRLTMQPAATIRLDIWFPRDRETREATIRIVGTQGAVLSEWVTTNPSTPLEMGVLVPRGEWTLEVTTDAGLSGSTRFSIDSLDREYPVVRVDAK